MTPLLEVERVSVHYGSFEAVTEASIAVEEGSTMAIVGESAQARPRSRWLSPASCLRAARSPRARCAWTAST
jgi:ABC-type phosphonate transport system ATPase subunit